MPVNGYRFKIYDKVPAECNGRGRGSHLGVAHLIGGLFRLYTKVAGMLHQSKESRRYTTPNAGKSASTERSW